MKVLVKSILEIKKIKDIIILKFEINEIDKIFPGQFFMIGPDEFKDKDFLLNRPFSVSNFENGILTFKIRICGRFTQYLTYLKRGDRLRILGPFGNFLTNDYFLKFNKVILLGGGIGIAPLRYFYNFLSQLNINLKFFCGIESKNFLHYVDEDLLKEITLYSDDGSIGIKGFVTEALKDYIEKSNNTLIIACGPVQMYKTLKNFENIFTIQVLVEEKMACGFGVCLGCVVNTINGYKRTCKEGPIFNLKELIYG